MNVRRAAGRTQPPLPRLIQGPDSLLDLRIADYQETPALHISAARCTDARFQDLLDQFLRHRVWFQPSHRPGGADNLEQMGGVEAALETACSVISFSAEIAASHQTPHSDKPELSSIAGRLRDCRKTFRCAESGFSPRRAMDLPLIGDDIIDPGRETLLIQGQRLITSVTVVFG
jgi:hypothetical protein